ncbi:MAG: discoidin domain-containing protein [Bacteroidales bacterium]|nr:discoidin domain-containing protein [Bacteroidales bacterium]
MRRAETKVLLTAAVLMLLTGIMSAQDLSKFRTKWFDPEAKMHTYCNPMNIDYTFEYLNGNSRVTPFRSTADPLILVYKDEYYLFCSNQSGFYWSKDLGNWNFIYSSFQRNQDQDDLCAPAAVVLGDSIVLMGSTYESLPIWYSTNPKSGRWQHLTDASKLPAWDPGLLLDDDGHLYLYYGSSGSLPVRGVELDRKTFLPLGDQSMYQELYKATDLMDKQKAPGNIKELVGLKPEIHGWERFGWNNDDPNPQWGNFIEGPWMNKHNGKYYLQYGAPGTEFKVYADGTWVSDHPLGPFTYQTHNPVSYKPGGFVKGAGHGGTFADLYGNYWHTATCIISVKYKFERRIGLYPAGFDKEGVMYCNTAFGDYPTTLPTASSNHIDGRFKGWMLLSNNKKVQASSLDSIYKPEFALDEDMSTYWSASSANPGEWLQIDLGESCTVNAIQVNYADHRSNQHGKAMDLYHQYKIYHSADGKNWELLVDKSYNDKDTPHDYIELTNAVNTRYLKLLNVHMATGYFAICGFRVFGHGTGAQPVEVEGFKVNRSAEDSRNAMIHWQASNAYGYNIYYGIAPDRQYNCITVNNATEYDFRGMDKGTTYYFSIEALNENGISGRSSIIKVD